MSRSRTSVLAGVAAAAVAGVVSAAMVLSGGSSLATTPRHSSAKPATAASATKVTFHYRTVSASVKGKTCRSLQLTTVNDAGLLGGAQFCTKRVRGLLINGKKDQTFNAPGANVDTYISTVASNGLVAVRTVKQGFKPPFVSYIRTRAGHFQKVAFPKAGVGGTGITGLNAKRVAVGFYYPGAATGTNRPFVLRNGHYRRYYLHHRGAIAVYLTGVNNQGELAGFYIDKKHVAHGFVDNGGKVTVINEPGAGTGKGDGTFIDTVGDRGDIVGYTMKGKRSRGFVLIAGRYHRIADPKQPKTTVPQGVNRYGEIAGLYDTTHNEFGFVATPSVS